MSTELLAKLDAPTPITGYLLELRDKCGEWIPCEFDCGYYPTDYADDSESDEWFDGDYQCGFFPEIGKDVFLSSSYDWDFRFGVGFNSDTTPTERPSPGGVWGGEIVHDDHGHQWRNDCDLWRVRRITIGGAMSEKAKEFFRKHPLLLNGLYK